MHVRPFVCQSVCIAGLGLYQRLNDIQVVSLMQRWSQYRCDSDITQLLHTVHPPVISVFVLCVTAVSMHGWLWYVYHDHRTACMIGLSLYICMYVCLHSRMYMHIWLHACSRFRMHVCLSLKASGGLFMRTWACSTLPESHMPANLALRRPIFTIAGAFGWAIIFFEPGHLP